ncbi:MAG: S8 family serine peptidase [Acidimicrobiales bacterium]
MASGNYGTTASGKTTISAPACVSSAIAVGATDDVTDTVTSWSSSSSQLALLAPGSSVLSSVSVAQTSPFPISVACPAPFSAGQCASESGTSMATPHAAAAFAVAKSANPAMGVDDLLGLLRSTGKPLTDAANGLVTPRVQLDAAVRPPTFHPLAPARILDTRDGTGGVVGPVGATTTITTTVAGRGGVPSSGVSAVVLNVTAAAPSAPSFVTVFPFGSTLPLASNLNLEKGVNRANLVVAKVGPAGRVSLYNNSGSVHLVADVAGWFDAGGASDTGARYRPVTPSRVLDTRDGTGLPGGTPTRVAGGTSVSFDPTTACGFAGATAVALNVTAAGPTLPSHVTVWPAGTAMPGVSNVNFNAGRDTPNLVVVKTGAGGEVSLFNNSGDVDLVADLAGCFAADASAPGRVVSVRPARVLDTRTGVGGTSGPVGTTSFDLALAGRGGVPSTGVTAVVLNLTATETAASSHFTVWPAGQPQPTASNVNFVAGQTVANLVVVKLGAGGAVSIANNAGTTQVVADVAGWITG